MVSEDAFALGKPGYAESHERQRFTAEERVDGLKQLCHGLESEAYHDEDADDDDNAADSINVVPVLLAAGELLFREDLRKRNRQQ